MRQFDFYFKVFNSRTAIAGAIINCSQTKFVAIIVLSDFFMQVFDRFIVWYFSSSKMGQMGSGQLDLSGLRAFQLCFSSNCFGDLYLWCGGRFLEVEDTQPPLLTPAQYCPPHPPPHRDVAPTQLLPTSPSAPWCTTRCSVRTTDR